MEWVRINHSVFIFFIFPKDLRRKGNSVLNFGPALQSPHSIGRGVKTIGDEKKHINLFNINFLAPTQIPPFWAPLKVHVPHFLGKNAKKGPTLTFSGGFWVFKKGVPNEPFSATKSLVCCSFLPLKNESPGESLSQEPRKGGFSKWGGFCRVRCRGQGNKKYPSILGPAVHLAVRAPQLREACIFAKTPF